MARNKMPVRITVSVPQREHGELRSIADEHGVTLAWLARRAISDFLRRYREGQLQLPLILVGGKSDE